MKELNKEKFKKEVEDYVKVLFRKSIKERHGLPGGRWGEVQLPAGV